MSETEHPRPSPAGPAGPMTGPLLPPGDMATVLDRNIQALDKRRRGEEAKASIQARVAQAITQFSGSMSFVYLHMVIVAAWIAINQGLAGPAVRFDPTYVILATAASVEGIFLSTFVLISQNRASAAADRRAELDVQVNLLSEHEITRLLRLTSAIAAKLDIGEAHAPDLAELQEHVAPEKVLDRIEAESARPVPAEPGP